DALSAWQDALAGQGLIQPGTPLGPAEFTRALYGYLARTPAVLIGVSLTDAVGDRRPQNLPGTTDQYPNWRIPLCDGQGRAVLLEDLGKRPGVRELARTVSQRPGGPALGRPTRGRGRPGLPHGTRPGGRPRELIRSPVAEITAGLSAIG